jgi:hypothetical protein
MRRGEDTKSFVTCPRHIYQASTLGSRQSTTMYDGCCRRRQGLAVCEIIAKQRSGKAFPKAKSCSCCQHTASRRSNRKTSGDVFLAECTATNQFCMSAGSLVLTLETFQHSRRSRCKPRAMWVRAVPLDFKVCVPSRPKVNPPMGGRRSGSPKWTSCNPLAGDVPRAPPPHPRAGWSRRRPIPRALDEISPSSGRRLNTSAASGAEI